MIKFECNGCGSCCIETTPSITLSELVSHYQSFPMVLLFEFHSDIHRYNDKEFSINTGTSRTIFVKGNIISIPTSKGCSNLSDDKRCNIYEERPLVCRLYPINPGYKPDSIKLALETEMKNNSQRTGNEYCEGFDNTENIIFTDGRLINQEDQKLQNIRYSQEVETNIFLEKMFKALLEFEYIQEQVRDSEGEILICTEDLIAFAEEEGVLTSEHSRVVLERQKELFIQLQSSFDSYNRGSSAFFDSIQDIIEYNNEQFAA